MPESTTQTLASQQNGVAAQDPPLHPSKQFLPPRQVAPPRHELSTWQSTWASATSMAVTPPLQELSVVHLTVHAAEPVHATGLAHVLPPPVQLIAQTFVAVHVTPPSKN